MGFRIDDVIVDMVGGTISVVVVVVDASVVVVVVVLTVEFPGRVGVPRNDDIIIIVL
jgi:hypothetical protein